MIEIHPERQIFFTNHSKKPNLIIKEPIQYNIVIICPTVHDLGEFSPLLANKSGEITNWYCIMGHFGPYNGKKNSQIPKVLRKVNKVANLSLQEIDIFRPKEESRSYLGTSLQIFLTIWYYWGSFWAILWP